MTTTVSTPVSAWVASLMAGNSVSANGSITATIQCTGGWEIQIPIRMAFSRVSSDPVVNVFATMDGGVNYDNVPMASFAITRVANGVAQASLRLPTGQYALQIQVLTSSDNATVAILTQLLITAINNV